MQGQKQRPKLSFGAIKELPGWEELAENTKLMFEVEAALLAQEASAELGWLDNGISLLYAAFGRGIMSTKLSKFLQSARKKSQRLEN